jgi:hypothetical protein
MLYFVSTAVHVSPDCMVSRHDVSRTNLHDMTRGLTIRRAVRPAAAHEVAWWAGRRASGARASSTHAGGASCRGRRRWGLYAIGLSESKVRTLRIQLRVERQELCARDPVLGGHSPTVVVGSDRVPLRTARRRRAARSVARRRWESIGRVAHEDADESPRNERRARSVRVRVPEVERGRRDAEGRLQGGTRVVHPDLPVVIASVLDRSWRNVWRRWCQAGWIGV